MSPANIVKNVEVKLYPELLHIGPIVISSFGVMMVIAFLFCNFLLKKEMNNAGLDGMIADELTIRAVVGGIVGAKLYYIIENIPNGSLGDFLDGIVNIIAGIFTLNISIIAEGIQYIGSGLVFYGGLMGGMLAITYYLRQNNLRWFNTADWVAPYLALGQGIGRIGCFLVGDDYGKPTDSWIGIAFPQGIPPTNFPVYPTQLFEMSAYFLIFIYLRLTRNNENIEGNLMVKYLILVGFSRFCIEFVRINPAYLFGLSGAQLISIIMMISGLVLLFRKTENNQIVNN